MSRFGGRVVVAISVAIILVCATLIAWRETRPPATPPTAAAPPVAEAPAPPIKFSIGPASVSAIIDLPGDPVVVQRQEIVTPRELQVDLPVKLDREASTREGVAYFLSAPLIASDGGYMGKFLEGNADADAVARILAANAATLAGGDDATLGAAEMDEDGWVATPDDAEEMLRAESNDNRLELALGGPPQNKQTVVRVSVPGKLSDLLVARGYEQDSAKSVELAAKSLFNHQSLLPNSVAVVVGALDVSGAYRVTQLAIYDGREYVGAVALAEDGAYVEAAKPTEPQDLFAAVPPVAGSWDLADGIYSAGIRSAIPETVIREAIQLIGRLTDLRAPAAADATMRLLYTKNYRGESKTSGRVVYVGLSSAGGPVDCYAFESADGAFACYDPRGGGGSAGHASLGASGAVSQGGILAPIKGAPVTSLFGMRFHPILHILRLHAGIDFGAEVGSPVRVAADGTVEFAGPRDGFGNHVKIKHQGFETSYSHLSEIPEAIKVGVAVKQGDIIARSGNTGMSTGPHLHFEYYLNGAAVDPLPHLGLEVQASAPHAETGLAQAQKGGAPAAPTAAQSLAYPGFKAKVDAALALASQ